MSGGTLYNNVESLQEMLATAQHKNESMFVPSLAQVGYHRFSPASIKEADYFVWDLRLSCRMEERFSLEYTKYVPTPPAIPPSKVKPEERSCIIPEEVKWVLCMNAWSKSQKWHWKDYLSLKNTTKGEGYETIGVFAERDFQTLSVVGWYIDTPTTASLPKQTRTVNFRNNTGQYQDMVVEWLNLNSNDALTKERYFRMGMQFIRGCSDRYPTQQSSVKAANVTLRKDGSVMCMRRIKKGEELVCFDNHVRFDMSVNKRESNEGAQTMEEVTSVRGIKKNRLGEH